MEDTAKTLLDQDYRLQGDRLFLFKPYLRKHLFSSICEICDKELSKHNWAILESGGNVNECSNEYMHYYNATIGLSLPRDELFNMFLASQVSPSFLLCGMWKFRFDPLAPQWIIVEQVIPRVKWYRPRQDWECNYTELWIPSNQ